MVKCLLAWLPAAKKKSHCEWNELSRTDYRVHPIPDGRHTGPFPPFRAVFLLYHSD